MLGGLEQATFDQAWHDIFGLKAPRSLPKDLRALATTCCMVGDPPSLPAAEMASMSART
jgi:hypothetical protein